jgi:hypothetical protein
MSAPAALGRRTRGALLVLAAGLLGAGVALGRAGAAPRGALAAGNEPGVVITATASGFQPKVVRLRKGESVRLVLRTTAGEQCFAVDELRIEKRILPGRDTPVDLTPDQVGSFNFYSCLEPDNAALRGRLIVSE